MLRLKIKEEVGEIKDFSSFWQFSSNEKGMRSRERKSTIN